MGSRAAGYNRAVCYTLAAGYNRAVGYTRAAGYTRTAGYTRAAGYNRAAGYTQAAGYTSADESMDDYAHSNRMLAQQQHEIVARLCHPINRAAA